mgnify:CR=1 FL=1
MIIFDNNMLPRILFGSFVTVFSLRNEEITSLSPLAGVSKVRVLRLGNHVSEDNKK